MVLVLLKAFLLLLLQIGEINGFDCPNINNSSETKPLYLLTLVPFRSNKEDRNIPGARTAQEEINNRTDLLPGYHIELIVEDIEACSRTEAGIGLSNLVKYTVNPPCRPVVAVTGLVCSSHTSVLSPVAGHDGFDLIQLSAANSPIFRTRNVDYSHLWRISGSATIYIDAVLAIMDQYNWTKIGVVYNTKSVYSIDLIEHFAQRIRESFNKTIVFSLGVDNVLNFHEIASNIKRKGTAILVTILNPQQTASLHFNTLQETLMHIQTIWISINTLMYETEKGESNHDHQGSVVIRLHTPDYETVVVVRNTTVPNYKHSQKQTNTNPDLLQNYMHDQVWALALAVNNSLPVLKRRNLSIDNYSIGQSEITNIIEEQLALVNFPGASGQVKFNKYRGVPTSVNIFWALENGTARHVGIYNSLEPSEFYININASDLPNDTLPPVYDYVLISLPVAILLYALSGAFIIFTTLQLVLYLWNRDHKIIKATSPHLSLLMFVGCYFLTAVAITMTVFSSTILSVGVYTALASTTVFLTVNGFGLVLFTLLVKLVRVQHIFSSWRKKDLGRCWNNFPLFLVIVTQSIIPNIAAAILVILYPPKPEQSIVKVFENNLSISKVHIQIEFKSMLVSIVLAMVYIILFLTLVLYIGVRNSRIKYKMFNKSCQIYFLLAVILVTMILSISITIIYLQVNNEPVANAVLIIGILIIALSYQVILFLPPISSVVFKSM